MPSLMQDSARFAALQASYVARQMQLWTSMLGGGASPVAGTPGDLRDRHAPDPLAPWRTAEADDGVDISDVLVTMGSFGHACV